MASLEGSVQIIGKTAAQWASANTVLLDRQPGLETDTNKLKFGDGVTAWNALDYFAPGSSSESGLVSGGIISVGTYGGAGTNNDIRVAAASWYIVGNGTFSTSVNSDFLDIALSSAGTQRYIGLYGTTSSTISKVEGSEAALATYPTQPANTALIGYVLVTDGSVSTTPDLSGYMLIASKATQATNQTGTNDDTYVTPLANAIKANLASPTFTGTPAAPTAAVGTNTTQLATTAFVRANILSPAWSGKWRSGVIGTTIGTTTGWAGSIIYANPYRVLNVHTVTQIRVPVTTGFAASTIRLALYDDNSGQPGALIEESGNLSSAASGELSFTFATPRLLTSKMYFLAIQVSSNSVGLRFWTGTGTELPRVSGAAPNWSWSMNQAYGAFPSNFSASPTPVAFNAQPMIELLVQ